MQICGGMERGGESIGDILAPNGKEALLTSRSNGVHYPST